VNCKMFEDLAFSDIFELVKLRKSGIVKKVQEVQCQWNKDQKKLLQADSSQEDAVANTENKINKLMLACRSSHIGSMLTEDYLDQFNKTNKSLLELEGTPYYAYI